MYVRLLTAIFFFLPMAQVFAQPELTPKSNLPAHPRLLWSGGEEQNLRQLIRDTGWQAIHQVILTEADKLDNREPVAQVKIGKRLLDKSRECLRRVFFLSYAWRMSGEEKYLRRAEQEMLAVAAFTDWNPSHFLDVAEMTLGMAIGYDWLYTKLSPASRTLIRNAIIEKGLKPSLDARNNGWLRVSNNWNQVCNAGMSYGALAVYEDEPVLAAEIINRAIRTIELPMKEYAPDGAYPEGYNYWGYGTGFNVLFLSALEKALGSDYGLSGREGFLKTAEFMVHMVGPTHIPFNFFDSGNSEELHPALVWFAARSKDPSVLWMERRMLANPASAGGERLLPAIMVWGHQLPSGTPPAPRRLFWKGDGRNPVVLMRSSWTDTAMFIGFKGGSPSSSHAHMDAGSFVLDVAGVRWAMDFGMQNYESLESKGVDLWNMRQQSQRWTVFRYNNYAHNTLTVNDSLQRVEGKGELIAYNDHPAAMSATVDMSTVYAGGLSKAVRKISLLNSSVAVVRDEVQAAGADAVIRWTMATTAEPFFVDAHTMELRKDGKVLQLSVKQPGSIVFKTWPATPVQAYDAPNPGAILVGFETGLQARAGAVIEVEMKIKE